MSTTVVIAEWIRRIVDDERKRDSARAKEDEAVARKAELVRQHGRRLVDELRVTVERDVTTFRDEFTADQARAVTVLDAPGTEGGFEVRKPAPAAVSLTVTPNLQAATLVCHYRFTLTDGLPPREDRVSLTLVGDGSETLQLKHHGTGQVFASADALSEFLLVPVLTGRPR